MGQRAARFQESILRIATFVYNNKRQVGQVSVDGLQVTPFALTQAQAQHGAQMLIDAMVAGQPLPALTATPLAISSVKLESPLPVPRRNVWCVGRNYHAHAKELQASVFKDSNTDTKAWPIVFTKVPECVVGPTDDVQLPGAAVSEQIDYDHWPRRQKHQPGRCDETCVRLHRGQRRDRP